MLGREAAQAGETYIKPELLRSRIGSEDVTVVEDPTVPGSYGFYVYDEEGVRARERVLSE
jgi:TldD protein